MHQVQPVTNGSNATPIAIGSGTARPAATIVIPAWNAWEHTERCLLSLRPTLGQRDQVVVVDNGSTDGTRAALAAHGWLDVVANEENQGFARGCNQGAATARGDVVVFLNSDTVVPPGWLDELLAPFEAGDVGAVGPRSNNVSGRQQVMAVPDPLTDPLAFAEFAEAWQTSHAGQTAQTRRLIGFCLAVRTSSFHALGGFDERFEIGGFEDDDLCRRLRQSELRLLIAHGSFVHHRGHASFDANDVDWRVTQVENRVRFEDKWGPDALRRPVLVSACLIVKNEEQMLPACLESVRDAVDEIVVYDTGSDDGTVEVAREAGATVVQGEWEDSFSAARNAALAHATGEWVLSIDADERLQTDPDVLRAQLAEPGSEIEAYLVAIENLHGPGNPRSVHTAIRVFRRRSTTWRHRLHEQVVAADDAARHLRTAYLSGARLIHHGYIAEVFENRNKADRNLELARAALDDGEVDRSYALMNLGRALESAGDSEEAVVRLSEAAESSTDIITRRLAVSNLVYILGRMGRFPEALSRLKELRQLSRSQVAADIAEGRTRLAMGETEEGLAILARIPSRGRDDDGMEYGPHVVAAIRGEALASLGRWGEGADVVLDAVRSNGVLEADVGELVHWLLQAKRSPAEITAALCAEDLVAMLGRILRLPPPLADMLLDGAWARFPDRLEPLAAAASVAPRLPLARALVWSSRLRQSGLPASCPLLAIGHDTAIDPVVRVRAAAALYGSFHDAGAIEIARVALDELEPAARLASEDEIGRLAPALLTQLGARVAAPPAAPRSTVTEPGPAVTSPREATPATPTRRDRVAVLAAAPTTRRGGLNIVGSFEGTSVEADVARRLAGALRSGGVPVSTTSYHRDSGDLVSPWSHHGPSDFPFDVNLLVVHPDHMTDFVLDSGPALFQGRYTIGLWVWDLQAPSPAMADAARMVHEVWTPTSWGAASVTALFRGPVHCVPIPVDGRPSRRDRASIGLPEGFVFASGIDYDTGFARQNPLGVVEAYTAAFSPADGHHLVIDAIHADRYPDEHARLVGAVDGRPDVAVRHSDGWSAAERDRLLASADCYLSLHRADGGLGAVAKAMSWGTFTVVTATAASLEFQTDQDSGLVRSEPASIPPDEYRYPSGAIWVEPDLQHASSLLRSAVGDAPSTAAKVRRARQVAGRRFSRSVVTAAVRTRLADVDDRLGLGLGHRTDRVRPDRGRDRARGRR
jgi:GT2 family glycosyltransferase/tetratricopeptide (TPR) repeat protein/glycosyltransferase involved in cell wall biosynthesis